MSHDEIGETHVGDSNGEFTKGNKSLCDGVGKSEFSQVLQVQQETVPGGGAEVLSRDSHVSIGRLIDVIADLFKAPEIAMGTFHHHLDSWVVSRLLFNLLGNVNKDNSYESDKSNNESSNSNRTWMLEESAFDRFDHTNFSDFILAFILVHEIVLNC